MKEVDIELRGIQKSYARPVLTAVDLKIDGGSYYAIVGKSGSGKSTLMNILGLIEGSGGGSYTFNGLDIKNKRDYAGLRLESIGFIFQSYNLIPTLTCRENILLPTLYSKKQDCDFDGLVKLLDIEPLLDTRVNVLSGGEKQRVAIARALILDPGLIIADEPTGNLDEGNRDIVLDLLAHEHEKGRAVIIITHDLAVAARADKILELKEGVLREKAK